MIEGVLSWMVGKTSISLDRTATGPAKAIVAREAKRPNERMDGIIMPSQKSVCKTINKKVKDYSWNTMNERL